jgi:hypothetical protein
LVRGVAVYVSQALRIARKNDPVKRVDRN